MEAKGKGMLKVVSILFIIFGAIATVVSIIALAGAALLGSISGGSTGLLTFATVLLVISSVGELVVGIIGIKKSGIVSAANFFIVTGIIFCVINLVSMIMFFQVTSLIGFVLPVLYVVGGFMNKKSASAPVEAPPA